jgi:PAS domain S-box-containing protein
LGNVIFLNPAAEALTGFTSTEAIGKPLEQVFDVCDLNSTYINSSTSVESKAHGSSLNTPPSYKLLSGGGGTERIVERWITPIRIDNTVFAGAVLTFRDVTERMRADEALHESSKRFTETLNAVSDLFVAFDKDWNYTYLNAKAAAFTGHRPEDLVGRNIWEMFPEAVGHEFYQHIMRTVGSQSICRFETAYADGRWYEHRAYPHSSGLSLFSSDITDQKRSEEHLLLRDRAINAANQGIVITDPSKPDNPILYASPGFERMTGYSLSETIGRNCRFLQCAESDPEMVAQLREAIRIGESCTVELINQRKDGTHFWNEVSISPVRDDNGRLSHFIGVQADVTERHVMSDRLQQSQKMESIGRLAGGVAHDFNNMLSVINGCTELVLETMTEDQPSFAMLKEVKRAGERAAGLTRQLLAYSRQQLIAPQLIDLNEVVIDTEGMLRRLLGEDIEFVTNLEPELWCIRADRSQMEQVLINLALNARDAMQSGGCITLATHNLYLEEPIAGVQSEARPGMYAVLEVSDTGCGIAPNAIDNLFEPFFTTKAKGKGTGLGLAVVHGIVTQSGGHIQVSSKEHEGALFRVLLPQAAEAPPTPNGSDVANELSSPRGGRETILLVEDEAGVRRFAKNVLSQYGYNVLEASSGNRAIEIASAHVNSVDLLVTDVVMPGLGGREVAEQIRKIFPRARFLFMSGYTDDAIVRNGIQHDEVNFLQKPFTPAALASKVRAALDERQETASKVS